MTRWLRCNGDILSLLSPRSTRSSFVFAGRGKAARQAQNARAYVKHHRRRGTTKSVESESVLASAPQPSPSLSPRLKPKPTPPKAPKKSNTLPSTILALATLPLPNSFLFHQALSGSPLIDESDLPQWDKPPPYDSPPPPDTPDEAQFTRNLVDVMHGRRLRMEREACARRAVMFERGEIRALREVVREGEERVMGEWGLDKVGVGGDGCVGVCERHRVMAECYRQWQARRMVKYRREAELLAARQNPYLLCVDQV
ncbi:hypothetical protein DFH29DRAFT_927287 [Suillus ampliporus]|nr:hypothetical protein DFH29DRAFT_927287 [Suillus ampliporus]